MICKLEGPDRVRKRPAVVFGSVGTSGVAAAVKLLIDVFCTEADLGYCDRISITLKDTNEIVIHCNDRGLCLNEGLLDGAPAWYFAFCRLDPGPREPNESYSLQLGLIHNVLYGDWDRVSPTCTCRSDHRADLCCVQYASEYLHAEAIKEHVKRVIDFQKGYCTAGPTSEPSCAENGTLLRFRLDPEVFGTYDIPYATIKDYLESSSRTVPRLHCTIVDERSHTKE